MKISFIPAAIVLLFTLNSCLYHPQTVDIPLIHKKNDFRFDGGIALLPPSLNSTISYGVSNKLALQVYGNVGTDKEYYYQGAIGYYKNLLSNTLFEVYGGVGYGYAKAFDGSTGGSRYGNYTLPFIQANFGKLSSESSNQEFGLGLKTGLLDFSITDTRFDAGFLN